MYLINLCLNPVSLHYLQGKRAMDTDADIDADADAVLSARFENAFRTSGAFGVYQIVAALPGRAIVRDRARVPYVDTGNPFALMFHELIEGCWHMRERSRAIVAALSVLAETRDMYTMDDLNETNVVQAVSRSFPMVRCAWDDEVGQLRACVQSVALASEAGFIGRQLSECVGLLLILEQDRIAAVST